MIKEIRMASSKYTIEYDPEKQWDYHIKRYGEDVSGKLRNNVLNDIVFYLTENIEKGVALEGITVTENKSHQKEPALLKKVSEIYEKVSK